MGTNLGPKLLNDAKAELKQREENADVLQELTQALEPLPSSCDKLDHAGALNACLVSNLKL